MKKFTFLLICLFPLFGTINAQENISATVEKLLERSAASGNPAGSEPADLYTSEEKLLLQKHFTTDNPNVSLRDLGDGDVYVASIFGGCNERGFGTFPLAGPFNINFLTYTTTKFYAGDRDDAGNLYGVSSDMMDENGYLVKIDPETGAETLIGNLNLEEHHLVTGLAWNTVNQTMYVMSTNSYNNKLYTVDLETAELTQIGGEMATRLGIWLAIDNEGNAFTLDIGPNFLYSVNLETAAATIIGPTGVQLRNAQDGGFDRSTGILYAGGYHGGGVSNLYSVNTTTGMFTNLGSVGDCAELGIVAFLGGTVGVSDNKLEGFFFYPNPSSDVLNLKSVKNIDSVSIYNLLGQEIMQTKVNATGSQLNISSLSVGTYIMKVNVNGELGTFKIIKN
ncbi:T9SS type A sorting domain-containing protein [Aequorivita sp. H23M31]|uniref:T9SS type A sorting domain-containing protein n=1 Tax=Aequorivita ciconiae TaxID=2494375 RepID=A0A410G6T6_9FLAO|nr:T9SS type A sorting domain-containing protein [Aequorivita sp. H23M31]QAA82931.1 T9SS type A sorting domain-containing protein [Aequorivita sp. H23M31]